MVRAAAKNHPSVAVVVNPAGYADVLAALEQLRDERFPDGSGRPGDEDHPRAL